MSNRIVLVGAVSSSFGYKTIQDAINAPTLKGSNLVLHDIDSEKLALMTRCAQNLNLSMGEPLRIQSTTDREVALAGADFVIVCIDVDRIRRWRLDWEIPFRYGVKQVLGENGGPGGLFHTLRMVPPMLEIAHDMERLCGDALMLSYTNPIPQLSLAVSRYSNVKIVGLCHEVEHQLQRLARIIGVPMMLLEATSAGLNHFSWFKKLQLKDDSDAYPLLDDGLKDAKEFQPLCRAIYRKFGLYPSTDDNHIGEYFAYAWEVCAPDLRGEEWIRKQEQESEVIRRKVLSVALDEENSDKIPSGEAAIRIISGIVSNSGHTEVQVNMPNRGQIPGILAKAVVESPAKIDRKGVHPVNVGELPKGISALLNIQILIQNLSVEAAVHGDRKKAIQALLADPVVQDSTSVDKVFNELFNAHRDLLPQFKED